MAIRGTAPTALTGNFDSGITLVWSPPRIDASQQRAQDESGAVIGIYAPVADRRLYEGVDSPASEKELRQSELDSARPLAGILNDLEERS